MVSGMGGRGEESRAVSISTSESNGAKCKKMQRAKCKQSSLVRQVSVRERNTSCCGISKKRTELETLTPYTKIALHQPQERLCAFLRRDRNNPPPPTPLLPSFPWHPTPLYHVRQPRQSLYPSATNGQLLSKQPFGQHGRQHGSLETCPRPRRPP